MPAPTGSRKPGPTRGPVFSHRTMTDGAGPERRRPVNLTGNLSAVTQFGTLAKTPDFASANSRLGRKNMGN